MKPPFIGLMFIAATATASAQIARPILPPTPGSSTTGTMTMSGCVTGGGVGAGPVTMMNPTILPSTAAPGSVASSVKPITVPPTSPIYYPPESSPYEPPAVGTTGSGATGAVGTTGVSPYGAPGVTPPSPGAASVSPTDAGLLGYRLTGSDMSSWLGRRVQVTGIMLPPNPEAVSAPDMPYFQDFAVQSVVPLTGVCPQP